MFRPQQSNKITNPRNSKFFNYVPRIFGFDYYPCLQSNVSPAQSDIERKYNIYTPCKDKKHKGINVICRWTDPSLPKPINQLQKWTQIVGNRTKLNEKLFKRMAMPLVENPQETINQTELIMKAIQEYRPDFQNEYFLMTAVKFLLGFPHKNHVHIFKIILSLCSSSTLIQFVSESLTLKTSLEDLRDCIKLHSKHKISVEWICTFMKDIFFIMEVIKETNPKGVCERIFTKFLLSHEWEGIASLIIMIVNSNPSNYENISLRKFNFIEVGLEELKKFQRK